jgi:nicotinamide phosphoribosyltransferase
MYPKGTEMVYSTWTPRTSRINNITNVVSFGQQAFIKKYLLDFFTESFFNRPLDIILKEYTRIIQNTLGDKDPEVDHIIALHKLGYLPLLIKIVPEGTCVPVRVPTMTIQNTDERFFWLTNYIETLASCELWQASTSATLAREYRKLLDKYSMETIGNIDSIQFQGHDFSMRGMSSLDSAISSGMGHLLSFVGTDTIPAIQGAEYYYGANVEDELVGTSIPATEHSVQCSYNNDEAYIERMITEVHPNGFVSIVSDGYDFWNVIGSILPKLKDKIMARSGGSVGGRVVIRPDSGDPVKIICGDPEGATELERKGAVEALWGIFGGTVSHEGYRILDSHIGLIYGDAITLSRCEEICQKLKDKGFASINCVYGIGSYTYQYNTRDTFGYALKSTLVMINGKEQAIFKDPKTDDGTKKSQKGRVAVIKEDGQIKCIDNLKLSDTIKGDLLRPIFIDGTLINPDTFINIRNRLRGS